MNNGGTCNETLNSWDAKGRSLPWGCYVYRERYTGSHAWGIEGQNLIQSVHKAPGRGYSSGSAFIKGF